jgi:thiol:disulfide interchange protein
MAFLGGILLNITPCVLPVVGLKAFQLSSLKEEKRGILCLHGIVFTLGILVAFWALAGFLYFFQSLGKEIGWGFQLQEPLFVAALIIVLFIFAMNLFGLFEIGLTLAPWAAEKEQSIVKKERFSLLSSFVSGLFSTVIATPCTGPLLGSVLGFAITFDPHMGFFLFSAIGLGLAFPMLLISFCPSFIRLLPKAGPWMITFKQILGFLLLLTIGWLVWVLENEVSRFSVAYAVIGFIFLGLALWIVGSFGSPTRKKTTRFFAYLFSLILAFFGTASFLSSFESKLSPLFEMVPTPKKIAWQPYSETKLMDSLKDKKLVFVDFEADWCLTCQVNKVLFYSPKVIKAFEKYHVVALKADWTNGDPEITKALRSLKRNGVPVYVIYQEGHEPIILSEMPTPGEIVDAIKNAWEKTE